MIVKGFWHIYMVNHWYSIVSDQLRILISSGLYDRSEVINISCIGTPVELSHLQRMIVDQHPKLRICFHSEDPLLYEFPALRLIEQDKGEYFGYYFHTKGVTRPFETIIQHWRGWLNESVLNRWKVHYDKITLGFDVSGVNYLRHPDHFSGNYWWFNRNYINRLPRVDKMDINNRYHAEQWICVAKRKQFSMPFLEPGDGVFRMEYQRPLPQVIRIGAKD